jgi:short-subunit dehydrogenase
MKNELAPYTKRIIIVGSSSGIGKEMALYFAKQGCHVAAAARRKQLLDELCLKDKNIVSYEIDVDEVETLQKKLQKIVDDLGGLDLFVISAGVGFINYELDFPKEQQTIKTNVEGFTKLLGWSYNFFKQKGCGQIAAITSVSGLLEGVDGPSYSASKAYQINYIKTVRKMAEKTCPYLIITELRPGSVDTDMMKGEGHFWVSKPEKAAELACKAIHKKKKLQYISGGWKIIGILLRLLSLWE